MRRDFTCNADRFGRILMSDIQLHLVCRLLLEKKKRQKGDFMGIIPVFCLGLAALLANELQAGPAIAGRIVDVAGAPIAGARVRAGEVRAVSDGEGRFRLELAGGPSLILVSADGFLEAAVEVPLSGELTVRLEILPR